MDDMISYETWCAVLVQISSTLSISLQSFTWVETTGLRPLQTVTTACQCVDSHWTQGYLPVTIPAMADDV